MPPLRPPRAPARAAALACAAAGLLLAGAASAAPGPTRLAPLPEVAVGPELVVRWAPARFTPRSAGRRYRVVAEDRTSPRRVSVVVPASREQAFITLADGRRHEVTVRAEERLCRRVARRRCVGRDPAHAQGPASDPRVVVVDATAPEGRVEVAGGAPYTRSRRVAVRLRATDPAPRGLAASGVRGVRLSQTGAFPCGPKRRDGCLRPFARGTVVTLAGPEGLRTVSAVFVDAARSTRPGAGPGDHGNASAPARASIFLDTRPPSPRVLRDAVAVPTRRSVRLDATVSIDGRGGRTDSGVDPRSIAWAFGDGERGRGRVVRHAYTRPGRYRGTLVLRDRAGNVARTRFALRVDPTVTGRPIGARGSRLLAPVSLRRAVAREPVELRWRDDPAARFYNVQLFRDGRKVLSVFPEGASQTLPADALAPGRYRLLVWSGLLPKDAPTVRYRSVAWVDHLFVVGAGRT
jgi:PKD domain